MRGGGGEFLVIKNFFSTESGEQDIFPFFSHKLSITFVVHAIFFSRRALAGIFFQNGVLLTKLAGMGITKSFWKWTQSYLSGRTQQVKLPGVFSRHGEVIAGVPQGSVISPTLFNVRQRY